MKQREIVRAEAEADITDAALWSDSHEAGLGVAFVTEIQSGIARALQNPESFTLVRRNLTVRRLLTRRFAIESSLSFD
jgi:hypothetical protein